MAFTPNGNLKKVALDAVGAVATKFALYSTNPGTTGTSGEISGGSPAYARGTGVWNAASSSTGTMTLNGTVTMNVFGTGGSPTTVAFIGLWNSAGSAFYGYFDITSVVFSTQGTLTIQSATLSM